MIYLSAISKCGDGFLFEANAKIIKTKTHKEGCDKEDYQEISYPKESYSIFKIASINDKLSIATGVFYDSDKQFALLDENFDVIEYFDNYPMKSRGMSSADLGMGLQGEVHSSGSGFIYTSNIGTIIKFFKQEGSKFTKSKEYIFSIPIFKSAGGVAVAQDRNNLRGILSTAVTTDRYYLLYNESKMIDNNSDGYVIYSFKTDGTPVEKIVLEHPIQDIVYSERYNTLIGVGEDNDGLFICKIEL